MRKILLIMLLTTTSAWAQSASKPAAKGTTRIVDNCAPIGKTAKGELVYSLKCDNMPAPPAPQAAEVHETAPAAAPEPDVKRSGIFGWSYDRRE